MLYQELFPGFVVPRSTVRIAGLTGLRLKAWDGESGCDELFVVLHLLDHGLCKTAVVRCVGCHRWLCRWPVHMNASRMHGS